MSVGKVLSFTPLSLFMGWKQTFFLSETMKRKKRGLNHGTLELWNDDPARVL